MTAHWEMQLQDICEQKAHYQSFIKEIEQTLYGLISAAKDTRLTGLPEKPFKPKRKGSSKKTYNSSYSKSTTNKTASKQTSRRTKRAKTKTTI